MLRSFPSRSGLLRRALASALLIACGPSYGAVLTIGAGRQYARIEEAYAAAQPGDTLAIYPASGDGIYRQPALRVSKPRLQFVGQGARPVILDGEGFEYSGIGPVPRAILQVEPDAQGVVIANLELRGAHNRSFNGAGVRINQADGVIVRHCHIHDNDMGIMSNGNSAGTPAARDQLIEYCRIRANGNQNHPGYNHNLYLGGDSVTLQYCDIADSLTGHNVKSRAHFNLIQYNAIHDSANRELDLVDAADTAREHSHSVLIGNFIVKKRQMSGNTEVIHCGRDGGGRHRGALFLLYNTIVTPYPGPVLDLSDPSGRAYLFDNIVFNPEQSSPQLVAASPEAAGPALTGSNNWISRGYDLSGTALAQEGRYTGPRRESEPGFADAAKGDYRLRPVASPLRAVVPVWFLDGNGRKVIVTPAYQYRAPVAREPRRPEERNVVGAGVRHPGEGG
jgi:hypothetical protein